MPSSHPAAVISLCCCVGSKNGFDSDIFAACGVFAFIVMCDAFKVRLPVSRPTEAFNRLQRTVCGSGAEEVEKVEGRAVPEIIVGFLVGVLVSIFMIRVAGIFG